MRHPIEGVLRRLIDEPAGVADSDREHVAGCQQCLGKLAEMREDAVLVHAALATEGDADVDVAAGWRRLSAAATTTRPAAPPPHRSRRFRTIMRRPVVAAVTFNPDDLIALPDLDAYGEVEFTGGDDVRQVADATAAAEQTGLDVPEVSELPRGVSGEPVYQVSGELTATFTFSAERAAAAAAESGQPLPQIPPGLDGSQVRLVAGPGLFATWAHSAEVPVLVVGRAVAPTAFSSGVPFETIRDYLLSLPGLPEDVAAQLRAFSADGDTLPLPVPADQFTTSTEDVNGSPATVLVSRDQTMAAVVWVEDGVVTAVAGALDVDEVLSVARELR
jgi:hypothetical protein